MSDQPEQKNITVLLDRWRNGDQQALDQLMPVVYEELYAKAKYYMGGERQNHTLSTTALVNEAYLKLFHDNEIQWDGRQHFFAVAARVMKNFLITYARAKNTKKRGGGLEVIADNLDEFGGGDFENLLPFAEGIEALQKLDKRKAWIIDMHYFAGMSIHEIAGVLNVSETTVKRDLKFSQAWLRRYIKK